jgi:hypothetical protein
MPSRRALRSTSSDTRSVGSNIIDKSNLLNGSKLSLRWRHRKSFIIGVQSHTGSGYMPRLRYLPGDSDHLFYLRRLRRLVLVLQS